MPGDPCSAALAKGAFPASVRPSIVIVSSSMRLFHGLGALAIAALCCSASAENWPQWRGPNFNGSSDEKNLPSEWSKESALWSTPMPGPSAATPIIWGDRVFVSTADPDSGTMHALCLDRNTGKILWDWNEPQTISRPGYARVMVRFSRRQTETPLATEKEPGQ